MLFRSETEVKIQLVNNAPQLMGCLVYGCRPEQDIRLLKNILDSIYDILELDNLLQEIKLTDKSMAFNWERAGGLDALEEV